MTPKLIRNAAILALSMMAGFLGHFWLTKVAEPDIYAFHDYTLPIAPRKPLLPGDIVAVSPTGTISRICNLKREAGDIQVPTKAVYYNALQEHWGEFLFTISSARHILGLGGSDDLPARPRRELPFEGVSIVVDSLDGLDEFEQSDCEFKMAMHMDRGYRPCTVQQSLIAVSRTGAGDLIPQTVALSLADWVNYVSPAKFEQLEIEYSTTAERVSKESCVKEALPFDARIRDWVGAIGREVRSVDQG